jgi:teichuronic acid biosynthesis glycosyltransferase TuaC
LPAGSARRIDGRAVPLVIVPTDRVLAIVTATTLYPNCVEPRHGIFVEERLLHLVRSGQISARVIAPVPWFPWKGKHFGRYARYAQVPAMENRHRLRVDHPRYPAIPKIGMHAAPYLMALALFPHFRALKARASVPFVVDGHFLYPDGVALAMIGRWLRVPVVLTARGSDVTWYCDRPGPRAMVRWAVRHCAKVVTVSKALRDQLSSLGAPGERLTVLPNGVDSERFAPIDRDRARAATGYSGFSLLSVGNLIPLKGHDIAVEAVAGMPDVSLVIIGDGPEKGALRRLIRRLGLERRVRMIGNVPQADLVQHYSAADALVLASESEGMPNVVLESLACGNPVVATAVGGIPELITSPDAGVLTTQRSPDGIVRAVRTLRMHYPDRSKTRAQGLRHGWKPTVDGLVDVYRTALDGSCNVR